MNWAALLVSLPVAFAGTFAARWTARRFSWLQHPGPGRIHTRPVPRLGGPAILVAFVAGTLVAVPLDGRAAGLLVGAAAAVLVTLYDDFRSLTPRDKFLGQLVVAAIPLTFGIRIDGVSNPFGGMILLPLALAIPFTLFWVTGMMNAINLVDGVDGLAAGVAAIAAVVLVVLSVRLGQPEIATMGLALVGAALGFLPFNFYRASIFMGDAGAHLLGYLIAVLAIIGGAKIATALLVLGIPILDVLWTLVRRAWKGAKVYDRDTGHLHHRLLRAGLPQPAVVLAYYAVCGGFGLVALFLGKVEKLYALAGLAVLMAGVLVALAWSDRASSARGTPRA